MLDTTAVTVWQRSHFGMTQVYARAGQTTLLIGLMAEEDDGAVTAIPREASDAELTALGFTVATDAALIEATHHYLNAGE